MYLVISSFILIKLTKKQDNSWRNHSFWDKFVEMYILFIFCYGDTAVTKHCLSICHRNLRFVMFLVSVVTTIIYNTFSCSQWDQIILPTSCFFSKIFEELWPLWEISLQLLIDCKFKNSQQVYIDIRKEAPSYWLNHT